MAINFLRDRSVAERTAYNTIGACQENGNDAANRLEARRLYQYQSYGKYTGEARESSSRETQYRPDPAK